MYVSITHFRVRNFMALLIFQWFAFRSYTQANKSLGIISKEVWPEKDRVFCTLTVWESKEHMLKFRNSGAHLKAMKISRKLGVGHSFGYETEEVPSRKKALLLLKAKHQKLDLAA